MQRTAFATFLLLAVGLASPSATDAEYFYYAGTGHYYGLTTGTETWTQAEAEAVADGGHLASITSQGEQDFLVSTFVTAATPGGDRQPFWIGLTEVNHSPNLSNRSFQWTTGESLNYTDWNPGEPNNNTGNEWYVAFNFHYGVGQSGSAEGTWNDTTNVGSVNGPYRGIIELNFNPAAVPEPASFVLFSLGTLGVAGYSRSRTSRARP